MGVYFFLLSSHLTSRYLTVSFHPVFLSLVQYEALMKKPGLVYLQSISLTFFFLSKTQSKKSYEQRCREADEAKLTAERLGTAPTATPKQIEKVNMFDGATHKRVLYIYCIVN